MKNTLTYRKSGNILLPNLITEAEQQTPLGRYGRMRRSFLRENRPILYSELVLSGKLFSHLKEIDETARQRTELLMEQYLKQDPAPKKETNPMEWVRHMNRLKAMAEETVMTELIVS